MFTQHNKIICGWFQSECLLTSSCAICSPPNQILRANIPSHGVTNSIHNIWLLHIDHSQDVFKSKRLCWNDNQGVSQTIPLRARGLLWRATKRRQVSLQTATSAWIPPLSISIMWQRWWALWHPHWSQITTKKKKKAVSSLFCMISA